LTAGYDSKQALIAASLGVEYIAPYLGRFVTL
jgi:transaldolase